LFVVNQRKFVISEREDVNIRIDKLLSNVYKDVSRVAIQNLIRGGSLSKNGETIFDTSYKTKLNDGFVLEVPDAKIDVLQPKTIPLDIVYEDSDLAVINKQAGLTTHPGANNSDNTLSNALLARYQSNLSTIGGTFRPGIVHRLDKDTSGLMIIAKNDAAHLNLSQQLQNKTLKRLYYGIIWGTLHPRSGEISGYMGRSKNNIKKMELVSETVGRFSLTHYRTIDTFLNGSLSLVEFNLSTGRTHQIRLHSSSKHCPLIGDKLYGGISRQLKHEYSSFKSLVELFPRQALHSYKISFVQPTSGKVMSFEISLPPDMEEIIKTLSKN